MTRRLIQSAIAVLFLAALAIIPTDAHAVFSSQLSAWACWTNNFYPASGYVNQHGDMNWGDGGYNLFDALYTCDSTHHDEYEADVHSCTASSCTYRVYHKFACWTNLMSDPRYVPLWGIPTWDLTYRTDHPGVCTWTNL